MLPPALRSSALIRVASSVDRLCTFDATVNRDDTIEHTMRRIDGMDVEEYCVLLLRGLGDDAFGHA